MDLSKHTAATGAPAKISPKAGGKWSAFGGMILGKNLVVIPNRMVVQAWRSAEWKKADPDFILIVNFEKSAGGGAQVDLVHVGVPEIRSRRRNQGLGKVLLGAVEGVSNSQQTVRECYRTRMVNRSILIW